VTDLSPTSIEADIALLDSRLRQLKVQYDMFFNGALPREPYELRADVERLIKRYANAPIRKYAQRFHFNSLVSRFNTLAELWTKTIRNMEEGDRPGPAAAGRGPSETVVSTCRIHDANEEQEALRSLHSHYLEARRKMGDGNGKVGFKAFLRGIAAQAAELRKKSGCEEVELRIVLADRKVQLKARPGR
jgi:hypothetical protein